MRTSPVSPTKVVCHYFLYHHPILICRDSQTRMEFDVRAFEQLPNRSRSSEAHAFPGIPPQRSPAGSAGRKQEGMSSQQWLMRYYTDFAIQFFTQVQQEDFDLCEGTQRGLTAGIYNRGIRKTVLIATVKRPAQRVFKSQYTLVRRTAYCTIKAVL